MSFALYEAFIPSMIQILNAGQGWIEKAKDCGIAEQELADACLIEGMAPFKQQIKWMGSHSIGAIEAVRKGEMVPDFAEPASELEQMRLNLGAAENTLRALSKAEIDSFIGGETVFSIPARNISIPFKSEDFLLSFSQPNFYFHATTAYDILRKQGLDIGKIDFLGQLRAMEG